MNDQQPDPVFSNRPGGPPVFSHRMTSGTGNPNDASRPAPRTGVESEGCEQPECIHGNTEMLRVCRIAAERQLPWAAAPWNFCPWCGRPRTAEANRIRAAVSSSLTGPATMQGLTLNDVCEYISRAVTGSPAEYQNVRGNIAMLEDMRRRADLGGELLVSLGDAMVQIGKGEEKLPPIDRIAALLAHAQRARESSATEQRRRVAYQTQCYDVANVLDTINGKKPGEGIVTGDGDNPTTELVEAVRALVKERGDLSHDLEAVQTKLDESARAVQDLKLNIVGPVEKSPEDLPGFLILANAHREVVVEVEHFLSALPGKYVIRSREGDGPENIAQSFALTIAKLPLPKK